jgi:peptidoglycan/xylan/chitin deacetylase (PgdA/CDA1 family)
MKFFILLLTLISALTISAQKQQRFIAVTIDDLPVVVKNSDLKKRQEITRKLLGHLKSKKIPAVGFVNENKLYREEKLVAEEVELLTMWLDAGLELGNHTFSHMSLHDNSLEDYKANILKGEIVTKKLLVQKNCSPTKIKSSAIFVILTCGRV